MVFTQDDPGVVQISRATARSAIVLVCEHASSHIPVPLNDLGLSLAARQSHVAWDPGALGVATTMAQELDAVLVASTVSRLVYDCNRPPDAPDAMPARSETYDIPGNVGLTQADKQDRFARYYDPFRDAVAAEIARREDPVIVTIHSFTPVFHGEPRRVELGVVHDDDSRLADALLEISQEYDARRNAPYGPEDGVTHTLKEHAIKAGHLNVMFEIRSDLIADDAAQIAMGQTLTQWILQALDNVGVDACKA